MKVLHCFFLHALLYLPIIHFAIIGKYKNTEFFFSNQNIIKYILTEMYADTMKLKETNPQLKILLAVGGWTHGTSTFTAMVL